MRTFETASDRFFRPADPQATRRNYRRVQVQKVLTVFANVVVVAVVVVTAAWIWQKTQRDTRFAIREISVEGLKHTPRASFDAATKQYVGRNLFKLDIEQVHRDLTVLPWIADVAIEKELPAKLVIRVTERIPRALVVSGGLLRYADADGTVFDELSPEHGGAGLPIITASGTANVADCVTFLESLKASSPDLYGLVSEVSLEDAGTFRVFDRRLRANVLVRREDAATKWRALHGIVAASGWQAGTLEYADLRFENRVIVRRRPQPEGAIESSEITGLPATARETGTRQGEVSHG